MKIDEECYMNRLCIYVTYNKENRIKEYMGHMVKALRECVSTLYVVCNYSKMTAGLEYIQDHVDDIFYRQNLGYDAGAYKDMLCDILGWDKVQQYDELVLLNDSFVGPFYELGAYFDRMTKAPCDFWGMTRNPAGYLESVSYQFNPHIHSYFMVFKKCIVQSDCFKKFWMNLDYPQTFSEAVWKFEIGINEFLEGNGFCSLAFMDLYGLIFAENEIPFLLYSHEMIRDNKLPILKKKSLLIRNKGFENALNAIAFLEEQHLYPTPWIWELLDSQFYMEGYASENPNCLEQFKDKYRKIYIYGAGVCGKNLQLYFKHKDWQFDGFIVSDKSGQDVECQLLNEIELDEDTGIIISVLNPDVSKEIVQGIGNRCKERQLFLISDCPAIRLPK